MVWPCTSRGTGWWPSSKAAEVIKNESTVLLWDNGILWSEQQCLDELLDDEKDESAAPLVVTSMDEVPDELLLLLPAPGLLPEGW